MHHAYTVMPGRSHRIIGSLTFLIFGGTSKLSSTMAVEIYIFTQHCTSTIPPLHQYFFHVDLFYFSIRAIVRRYLTATKSCYGFRLHFFFVNANNPFSYTCCPSLCLQRDVYSSFWLLLIQVTILCLYY